MHLPSSVKALFLLLLCLKGNKLEWPNCQPAGYGPQVAVPYHTNLPMLRLEHCVQQVIDSYMFPGNKEEEAVLVSYLRMC